ncbi:CarD family transcriptional regulator [Oceanobacillus senegalensis]|uniref:CarD family transcriptional regulator n=1 Tax=Oceanobacillus senegalensis TaxID=1936063 RepID=UPI001FEBC788|nr:CarD family transcriptional regulator [Oceanobacillus senegalensis]
MMFKTGDLVIYSVHGLCVIDDICERTIHGETKTYYVLHPTNDSQLKISVPVESKKAIILKTLNKEEAEDILQLFKRPGVEWIDDVRQRNKQYSSLVKTGERRKIAMVARTLIQKDNEAKQNKKRLYDQDQKLLSNIQENLFKELASALDTSPEEIQAKVKELISQATSFTQ